MFKLLQKAKAQNNLKQIERIIQHYDSKLYYMSVTQCNCVDLLNTLYIKQFYYNARMQLLKQL